MSAAPAAVAPKETLRPLGPWLITPCAAVHSVIGTFQRAAAAAMSIARAVAPAQRSSFCEALMERLAPVDILPQTRSRLRFSCGGANSALTLLQPHSSFSATSIGSAVKLP